MAEREHTNHGEYDCPGCRGLAEHRIVADVYGCDAGRHCTQVTLEQRNGFEKQIAARLDAWRQTHPETR